MKTEMHVTEFIPPFCPNFGCLHHKKATPGFYKKNGTLKTSKSPFLNQRYKCLNCHKQFSKNSFSVDHRKKIPDLGEKVLFCSLNGMSNNSISKFVKVSERTVRNRLRTLSVQSLLFEKLNTPSEIFEDVAYDGFETFTHSQFSPCYINTAVGRRSHFIYHNTLSPLNRKGRMTADQKIRQKELLEIYGPYPKDSVFQESCYVIREIEKKARFRIRFFTDLHKSYGRAYNAVSSTLYHEKISSQARRDPSNNLFPVNHLHMIYRHALSSQQRETIAFQKHEGALLEKIQLMKVYRNYMLAKFEKRNAFDKQANIWSPAMYLGITDHILEFNEIFGTRRFASQVHLDKRECDFLSRNYDFSRQKITL